MTGTTLKVAVLSDLHVFNGMSSADGAPSFIGTADPQDSPMKHPFCGLQKLITDHQLSADLLICPGDLSDKADPAALIYAWDHLNKLKEQLGARELLATNGNHDIDSRYVHDDYDAKGMLQSLVPMFPGTDEALCDRYWSRNFATYSDDQVRVVLLNSAAFHGSGRQSDPEFEHGRISMRTVAALRAALAGGERRVNILVCHHHPAPFNPVEEKDYSEMIGGDRLIELLDSGDFGSWLMIHGHKHYPRVAYAAGSPSSPIIFSAGSFSAQLYQKLQGHARNQFYLMEIPIGELDQLGLDLAGTLRAWDWIGLIGWQTAGERSGLPHKVGFGWREPVRNIASTIATQLPAGSTIWDAVDLDAALPRLRYLRPEEIANVAKRLKADHQITARLQDGVICEVGRP